MDELHPAFAIIGGVMAALLVFAAMLLSGLRLVRWLGLNQDMPEGAQYSPPAPALRAAGDPAGARVIAGLQARRRALFTRARAIRIAACQAAPTNAADADSAAEARVAAADACIAAATLDDASLTAADTTLAGLEL